MMKFNHLIFLVIFSFFSPLSILFGSPTITTISPHFGPVSGGTFITIKGAGFKEVEEVYFGNVPALSFQVIDEETIEALAPPQTFGAVHVKIKTTEGSSELVHAAYYTYQGSWFAYIPNFSSDTVTAINLSTGNPEEQIAVGNQPNAVVIAPDGKMAYVTVTGLDSIVPIDLATHQAGMPISVKGSFPALLSIAPDGKKLYVANQNSHRVTIVDLITYQIKVFDHLGYYFPFAIATTPNGLMAYITNSGSNTVTPFDLITHTNQENIQKFNHPSSLALTPDGKKAYIVNAGSNSVTPLDLKEHKSGPEIAVGITNNTGIFADIAICPKGKKAYVTNPGSNSVTSIDLKKEQVCSHLSVGYCPDGIAITPDGKMAYVSNAGSNDVTPIDLIHETAKAPIAVGKTPSVPAITPDQAPVAYFSTSLTVAGSESVFDASASLSPVGVITRYRWDFGDGSEEIDSQDPIVTHLYSLPGKYQVTLTVENSAGTSTNQIFTGRTMNCNGGKSAQLSQMIEVVTPISSFSDNTSLSDSTKEQQPQVEPKIEEQKIEEPKIEEPMIEELIWPVNSDQTAIDAKPADSSEELPLSDISLPASSPVFSSPSFSSSPINPPSSIAPTSMLTSSIRENSSLPRPILPIPQGLKTPLKPSPDTQPNYCPKPMGVDQYLRPGVPSHLRGYHKKVSSRGKKQVLHVLSWKAPKGGSKPVSYRIYHNSSLTQLAGEVPAHKKLQFQARQKKGIVQTYYIVSVDKFGRKSPVACLVVPAMGRKR